MPDTTKQPIIRPGQHKPYTKATRKEIERRIKAAAILESLEWETTDIHWFFQEVFGVEARQIARYLARARVREGRETGFSGDYSTSSY